MEIHAWSGLISERFENPLHYVKGETFFWRWEKVDGVESVYVHGLLDG